MLHTVSNSSIDVDLVNMNDAVLFWQNGVILAIKDNPILMAILAKTPHCYALDNDILARGLMSLVDSQVTVVSMLDVISLTELHHPQMKW